MRFRDLTNHRNGHLLIPDHLLRLGQEERPHHSHRRFSWVPQRGRQTLSGDLAPRERRKLSRWRPEKISSIQTLHKRRLDHGQGPIPYNPCSRRAKPIQDHWRAWFFRSRGIF